MKRRASAGVDDGTEPKDSTGVASLSMTPTQDSDNPIRKLGETQNDLDELTYFVNFMETRIMPDAGRYSASDPSPSPSDTIRYEDMWYLFEPGTLVYSTPDPSSPNRFRSSPYSHRFLRVIQTHLTTSSIVRAPIRVTYEGPWSLPLHFIEYDGVSYSPAFFTYADIVPFPGRKKVTDLPVYPVSYLENDQIFAQAQSDGATYVSLIERRSGLYSGWTQIPNSFGTPLTAFAPDSLPNSPEHIESDILVDFQETFNAFPGWKLSFFPDITGDEASHYPVTQSAVSALPILELDDLGRVKHDQLDFFVHIDNTEVNEAVKFMKEDALGQFRKDTRSAPTRKFLALLPTRFFAYAVLQRKFVQLNTRFVRSSDIEANDKAFEKLEISHDYKRLILALVKSHFDKVETENRTNTEIETQDLIRGKGKGVVILLHGVPGVGKTATAEAVALKWKKPLFPITCGDLGYTADTLEKSLNEIFRLAHHWGCILLLDEADVFITQRERHDLKRNALVSAFLRVLEYYNGIMFLTTNRAGVLDEAIKSRVHLNLHYDHLSEKQTVAIFQQHIQRLRDIEKQRNSDPNEQVMVLHKEIIQFAEDHYNRRGNRHGQGSNVRRWNGRQIRNVFLIVSSLAHYDSDNNGDDEDDELAEPGRKKQKQLGRREFELVAQTTFLYDQYRESVHSGKSDDHVAFEREERAMLSQPRSPTPVRMKNMSKSFS
ncbi:hypothetical protein LA080_006376 [Diaporthe eres]|nr:hypothetical protein LA080_006376 [Diaporthe eres]